MRIPLELMIVAYFEPSKCLAASGSFDPSSVWNSSFRTYISQLGSIAHSHWTYKFLFPFGYLLVDLQPQPVLIGYSLLFFLLFSNPCFKHCYHLGIIAEVYSYSVFIFYFVNYLTLPVSSGTYGLRAI